MPGVVMRGRSDPVSVVAGVAVTLLGLLALLDRTGVLRLDLVYGAPAVLAAAGVVLLVLGLSRGGG